jgi:hypothetical protein
MTIGQEGMANVGEQLELAYWLIERYDNLRSTVANRAAIIVSADAVFLAAVTFLLDKVSSGSQYSQLD